MIGQVLSAEDRQAFDAFCAAMLDAGGTQVCVRMDLLTAFALVGALQLVTRHPELGEGVAELYRETAAQIERQLPAWLQPLAAKGWAEPGERAPRRAVENPPPG